MPIIPMDALGDAGIIKDLKPHELPMEAWSAGNNVRFKNGEIRKMLGESSVLGTPTVAPHFLMRWATATTYYYFYANGSAIYRVDGTTHLDVTRSAGAYTAPSRPVWNGGNFNGVPIMNNGVDYPQSWDDGTTKFVDLPNWPASVYADIIKPYKNQLVAYRVTQSGVKDNQRIKWSSIADPGAIPSTWVAAASNRAGEVSLAETGDFITSVLPLRDMNLVYKEEHVWGMQFVGGQSVYRFWQVFDQFGALADNCVVSFPRGHFVVAKGDVFGHNGQDFGSLINKKNRNELYSTMSNTYYDKTFVVHNLRQSEIWICYVTTGSTYADRACIWNYQDNTWTFRDLPDIAFATLGVDSSSTTTPTFDSLTGTFNAQAGIFDERTYNPSTLDLILASPTNTKFYKTDDTNQFDGTSFESYIERSGIGIEKQDHKGNMVVNLNSVKFVRGIYPKVTGDAGAILNIYLATQDTPYDNVEWQGPYPFVIGTDVFVDMEVSTKLYGIRVTHTGDAKWQWQGYDLDLDVISRF